ncbi:hypothetical protein GGR54DRAFT_90052 [Hypoxylon sp. NC1633]|nr:hypothetical protein GGR54DRAFT_90052 [Hypoxylon sp. NC1633]
MSTTPVNPDDLGIGPMIMGLTWTFAGLVMTAVGLRFYVRRKQNQSWGWWEDWLMLVAMIFQIAEQSTITVSYHYGLGKHDQDLRPRQLDDMLKWMWASLPSYIVASILARISIAIFLVRLFGVYRWFKCFVLLITALVSLFGVISISLVFVQYTPVEKLWTPSLQDFTSMDPRIPRYPAALFVALCAFTDLTFVFLPVMFIWRLNMPLRRRVGLMALMGVSVITAVLSILKTGLVYFTQGNSDQFTRQEFYNESVLVLCGGLEQYTVIILGCVPQLHGLGKLGLPGPRKLASSLLDFFIRNRSKKLPTLPHPGPYIDLEMSTTKLGHCGPTRHMQGATTVMHDQGDSHQNLVEPNHLLRVDRFTISYNDSTQTGRGVV